VAYDIQNDPMHGVYFRQAYTYAMNNSKDPSTQNVALLTDGGTGIITMECNNIPDKVNGSWERPDKYHYVEHAERNVLYKAAKLGISTQGLTMYCPWYSCSDCARAIIQCGIKRVIGHKEYFDRTPDRWKESCGIGIKMMQEAGIECLIWSGIVGGRVTILVDGKEFSP
tara:strand:- start:1766 stop:2272 length:507 start_codon:yes stop_codon:yes gene_type:complete